MGKRGVVEYGVHGLPGWLLLPSEHEAVSEGIRVFVSRIWALSE